MKKLLLSLFALTVALVLNAEDFSYEYEGQTLVYTVIDENAKLCQTKEGSSLSFTPGNKVSGNLVIPSVAKNKYGTEYRVVSIGARAFRECTELNSVSIPTSVTAIGEVAFCNCSGLTSMTIPNSVSSIADYTFAGCSGLTEVNIPESVTSLGKSAFSDCKNLTSITIPESVSVIGERAFYYCIGLTSITIPNSVSSIAESTFFLCTGLTEVNLPNSITSIGRYAFSECHSLTSINIPNSVTSISEGTFRMCGALTSVNIPNSVEYIHYIAFYRCSSLTSITIPNSVKEISDSAFQYCSGLKSITILGRTICHSAAFDDVNNVESLKINENSSGCYLIEKLKLVQNQQTTQRTVAFTISATGGLKVIDDNGNEIVPEAKFNGQKIILNSTNDYKFSDLQPDYHYGIWAYGVELANLTTKPVLFNGEISSQFADKAIVTASFDSGDCEIENIRWKFGDNLKYEGRTAEIYYSGLNDMGVICEAEYNGGVLFYDLDLHFPEVTVTNQSAQATSLTSCRLSADINFSDGSVAYIEWRRNDAPDNVPSQVVECPVVGQKMLGELRGLRDDVYYQFRPYVERGDEKHYGEWTGFYTGDANVYFAPEVNTMAARVEGKSVMMAGYVLQGTDPVTSRGFELKSLGNITRAGGEWVRYESTGTLMYVTLDDLAPGTDYVYRVYADTQKGTSYGDEMSFSTPALSAIEEIENNEKENSLNVSLLRNPVEQAPVVKVMASAPEAQIAIVSTDGRTCYQGVVMTDGHPQTIDVNLQPGMYLVVVASGNERKTIRMIVR